MVEFSGSAARLIPAALMGFMGGGMLVYAVVFSVRRALKHWTRTAGTIEGLEVIGVEGEATELAVLVVSFDVDDERYIARHVIYESPLQISESHRQAMHAYYPVGSPVSVYYPPEDPSCAQLEAQTDDTLFSLFLLIGAGLVLVFIACQWGASLSQAPRVP